MHCTHIYKCINYSVFTWSTILSVSIHLCAVFLVNFCVLALTFVSSDVNYFDPFQCAECWNWGCNWRIFVFQFKFLCKDSVRFLNSLEVEGWLKNYLLISSNVGWTTYALLTGFLDRNNGGYVFDRLDTKVNAKHCSHKKIGWAT